MNNSTFEDKIGLIKSEIYDANSNYERLGNSDEIYPLYFSNRLRILYSIEKDLEFVEKVSKYKDLIRKKDIEIYLYLFGTEQELENYYHNKVNRCVIEDLTNKIIKELNDEQKQNQHKSRRFGKK